MLSAIRRFLYRNRGATAIEFGLIAALVSVAAIVALAAMGESLDSLISLVSSELAASAGS